MCIPGRGARNVKLQKQLDRCIHFGEDRENRGHVTVTAPFVTRSYFRPVLPIGIVSQDVRSPEPSSTRGQR